MMRCTRFASHTHAKKNERPQMRVKISRAPAPPHIREKILAHPRTGIRAPTYTRKNPRVPTRLTRARETPPHTPKTPSRARKSRRRTHAPAHAKTRTRAHTHARLFFPGFISKISSSARTRKKSEQFDFFQTLFKFRVPTRARPRIRDSRTHTRPRPRPRDPHTIACPRTHARTRGDFFHKLSTALWIIFPLSFFEKLPPASRTR